MNSCPSVIFYTVGCRLNQAETRTLENLFSQAGYRTVRCPKSAQFAVINTCTVTARSDSDTRKLLRRVVKSNPDILIALTGCQAELQGPDLRRLANVKWIVGNGAKFKIPQVIKDYPSNGMAQIIRPPLSNSRFRQPACAQSPQHTRANLKVQDGCDCFCTYCEVPYARGRARSREFNDILREAKCLVGAGHAEIVLTGINIGCYNDEGRKLPDLVKAISGLDAVKRIRISSIEPQAMPSDLMSLLGVSAKLCRHLHIPVQHASDDILKRMNRRYRFDDFNAIIKAALKRAPQLCIGTDIIVGFPGETESHFDEMLRKLKQSPIHYFHVFSYSDRPNATAKNMSPKIDAVTIARRSRILRRLSQIKRRDFYRRFLGTTQEVLFEQSKEGWWHGLSDHYIHIRVRSKKPLARQFRQVRLTAMAGQMLLGETIESPKRRP